MSDPTEPAPEAPAERKVLFVCEHNGGRSQMAAALLHKVGAGAIPVRSAGPDPAAAVNPAAVEAMAEIGVDLSGAVPKQLTPELLEGAGLVIDCGCEQPLAAVEGQERRRWEIGDPAGESIEAIRPIRVEIESAVAALFSELRA